MTCPPHHWVLDREARGVCKFCSEVRQFDLTIPSAVYLGDHAKGTEGKFTPEEKRRFLEYLDEQAARIPE